MLFIWNCSIWMPYWRLLRLPDLCKIYLKWVGLEFVIFWEMTRDTDFFFFTTEKKNYFRNIRTYEIMLKTELFYHLNFYRSCWHPIQVWVYLLVLWVSRAARLGSFCISTSSEWQISECHIISQRMSDTSHVFGHLGLFSLPGSKAGLANRKKRVLLQHLLNNRIDHCYSGSDSKEDLIKVSWHYIVTALDA